MVWNVFRRVKKRNPAERSPKPCRRVCCRLLSREGTLIALIAVVLSSFELAGVLVYFNVETNIEIELAPTDSHVTPIHDRFNTFFCGKISLKTREWLDEQPLFSAYLLNVNPGNDSSFSHESFQVGIRKRGKLGTSVRKTFYLLKDSVVSFQTDRCSDCMNITVYEGYENYKHCRQNPSRSECQDYAYAKLKVDNESLPYSMTSNKSSYYFFQIGNCDARAPVNISLIMHLNMTVYRISNFILNCTKRTECSFDLRFREKRYIMIHMNEAENPHSIKISCEHRKYVYILLFGVLPLFICAILITLACFCNKEEKSVVHKINETELLLSTSTDKTINYGSPNGSFQSSAGSQESESDNWRFFSSEMPDYATTIQN